MTIGEQFVKETLSRDLQKDFFSYEDFQAIKKITEVESLKKYLQNHKFVEFDQSINIEDIVDQTMDPFNHKRFLSKKNSILISIPLAFAIILYSYSFGSGWQFFIFLPIFGYYAGIKFARSKMKNSKYISRVLSKDKNWKTRP